MHLVLNMFIFTRSGHIRENHLQTTLLPQFQSMRTQVESTYTVHNMFGQIKMKIPWFCFKKCWSVVLKTLARFFGQPRFYKVYKKKAFCKKMRLLACSSKAVSSWRIKWSLFWLKKTALTTEHLSRSCLSLCAPCKFEGATWRALKTVSSLRTITHSPASATKLV